MVTEKDRKDYEEGRRDAKENCLIQAVRDALPGTHSEAYYKGRGGEQLDADKKDEKKR